MKISVRCQFFAVRPGHLMQHREYRGLCIRVDKSRYNDHCAGDNDHCPCQDPRYKDDLDRMVGYSTDSLLSMPIRSADGDIIGVVQVINKNAVDGFFTKDDEKVPACFDCVHITTISVLYGTIYVLALPEQLSVFSIAPCGNGIVLASFYYN